MFDPRLRTLAVLLAAGMALAAGSTYSIVVGGQVAPDKAIVVNGKTYLPLSVLKALGIPYSLRGTTLTLGGSAPANQTPGGANQRASLEGCLGETLFNGIWRFRAIKLEPIVKDAGTPLQTQGWGVTVELRSGAKAMVQPVFTGLRDQGIQVAFDDAQTLTADALDVQKLTYANLPPGGVVTHQLKFWYRYDTPKEQIKTPTKLLLEINPNGFENAIRASGASYTTPTPSLRVRLDCQN
ncbi:hypothetical protein [Meiothermus hypogaeus]|uniref:Copper amine oxidase-like N-terminal domain-containing protein n=2 Tax=Meiothermus hypogaeus TaxID=884155 RepID=A0A511R1L7_9DEIN|nr:hypothetical protein [Meiothermus hypogaeus]RIH80522.1 hypothetical protein Mhypo_00438 [Meiothermus hypogaeus]GEM83505.1 hypothetical protein MHY01S_16710 [Meiothermus hypogaeus NBRC 106114]